MADDKKDPWLNWLALSTVILAVCATLSTFKGGGYSTRAVMTQSQASDQWAYYQAKSVKQNLYEVEVERLKLQIRAEHPSGEAKAALEDSLQTFSAKIKKYEQEKADISSKAKALEAQRDAAQLQGKPFGLAVIFLQIAILLSSIASLLKRQYIWWGGVIIGFGGLILFADGFFLFLSL